MNMLTTLTLLLLTPSAPADVPGVSSLAGVSTCTYYYESNYLACTNDQGQTCRYTPRVSGSPEQKRQAMRDLMWMERFEVVRDEVPEQSTVFVNRAERR